MSTETGRFDLSADRLKLGLFAIFGIAFLALAVPPFSEPMLFWTDIFLGGYEFPSHELHHFVLGSVFGILLLGVIAQALRPSDRIGALHSSVLIWLAFVVTFTIGGEFSPMHVILLGLLVGMAVTHPLGREQLPSLSSLHRPTAVVAAITALAALVFAGIELSAHFGADDAHVGFGHYLFMTTAWLSIGVLSLRGSLRDSGWRFPTYAAAVFLLVIGLGSIAYPGAEQGSSLGVALGVVTVLWAALLIVVAERGDSILEAIGS